MEQNYFAIVTMLTYFAALGRLLFYSKHGGKHQHHISFVAWILMVVLFGSVVDLCLRVKCIGFFDVARAVMLALFIFRARGNVARLLWSE